MKRQGKPIGKCIGCELNTRDRCAVFESPRAQWARGKCRGRNHVELITQHAAEPQASAGAAASRERRRALFKLKRTEPHYQGVNARK